MDEAEVTEQVSPEMEEAAREKAIIRARVARWDLDIALFLFVILIVIIILLFQGIGTEVVAPIAIFGLAMVWFSGWRKGKQLYQRFYEEELLTLEQEARKSVEGMLEKETIEDIVTKALCKRWNSE